MVVKHLKHPSGAIYTSIVNISSPLEIQLNTHHQSTPRGKSAKIFFVNHGAKNSRPWQSWRAAVQNCTCPVVFFAAWEVKHQSSLKQEGNHHLPNTSAHIVNLFSKPYPNSEGFIYCIWNSFEEKKTWCPDWLFTACLPGSWEFYLRDFFERVECSERDSNPT